MSTVTHGLSTEQEENVGSSNTAFWGIKSCFHLFKTLKPSIWVSISILHLWRKILRLLHQNGSQNIKQQNWSWQIFTPDCSTKHADKENKVDSFRAQQQVLRKQTEAYQHMRGARRGLPSTVEAGQRILKGTLQATVHEVMYFNSPHAHA